MGGGLLGGGLLRAVCGVVVAGFFSSRTTGSSGGLGFPSVFLPPPFFDPSGNTLREVAPPPANRNEFWNCTLGGGGFVAPPGEWSSLCTSVWETDDLSSCRVCAGSEAVAVPGCRSSTRGFMAVGYYSFLSENGVWRRGSFYFPLFWLSFVRGDSGDSGEIAQARGRVPSRIRTRTAYRVPRGGALVMVETVTSEVLGRVLRGGGVRRSLVAGEEDFNTCQRS